MIERRRVAPNVVFSFYFYFLTSPESAVSATTTTASSHHRPRRVLDLPLGLSTRGHSGFSARRIYRGYDDYDDDDNNWIRVVCARKSRRGVGRFTPTKHRRTSGNRPSRLGARKKNEKKKIQISEYL